MYIFLSIRIDRTTSIPLMCLDKINKAVTNYNFHALLT